MPETGRNWNGDAKIMKKNTVQGTENIATKQMMY